jgi:hypothetical protein
MDLQTSVYDDIKTKQCCTDTSTEWPKRVLEWMPPGRRKTGRPRVRWTKLIQDAMEERRVQEGQQMDREEWRLGTGRRQ